MKIIKVIGLMIFLILNITANGFSEETIRITNGEWTPYHSKNLKHYGVVSHIVSEAFALEGIKVKYGWFPWARAKDLVKMGEWDGSVPWAKNPAWKDDFYFSDAVYEGKDVFFHLKSDQFDWETIDDLQGITIGGIISYTYGEAMQKALKAGKIKIFFVPKEIHNFKKMLVKRIKIYPENLDVGYDILNNHFPPETVQKFTHHSKPFRILTYHIILSKKIKRSKVMIDLFNKGLKRLKNSGKYDQYFAASRRGEYRN
jgi:polar amino acid transport system substrate-binding protein